MNEAEDALEKLKSELRQLESVKTSGNQQLSQYKDEQLAMKRKIEELELNLASSAVLFFFGSRSRRC